MDFPLQASGHAGIQDTWNGLNAVLQILGKILEPPEGEGARKHDPYHRDVGEIDLLDHRIILEILRQVRFCLVHLVSHLLECVINVHTRKKLDSHCGYAFGRGGPDFFQV